MSCVRIIQGETTPFLFQLLIPASVETETDFIPYNLTNCSVTFKLIKDDNRSLTVDASAEITDAVNGWVKYEWDAGETDITGMYRAQFNIIDTNSKVTILPKSYIQWIYIIEEIAG